MPLKRFTYTTCKSNEPCPRLAEFLGKLKIYFAGVDIGNDITRLERCNLIVSKFLDISGGGSLVTRLIRMIRWRTMLEPS
jgi:hypothetical protein